eukprot:502919_1
MKVFTSLLTIIYLISVSSATPLSISNSLSLVSISSFIAFTGATSKNETALLRRRMRGGKRGKPGKRPPPQGPPGQGRPSPGKGGPLSKGGPSQLAAQYEAAKKDTGGKKYKGGNKYKVGKDKKKKIYFSFASLFAAHSNDEYNVDGDENVEYEISFDNGKKDKGG